MPDIRERAGVSFNRLDFHGAGGYRSAMTGQSVREFTLVAQRRAEERVCQAELWIGADDFATFGFRFLEAPEIDQHGNEVAAGNGVFGGQRNAGAVFLLRFLEAQQAV